MDGAGGVARSGVTLVEMLIVVALTVLLMSIIAEVFVLASETLSQLKSISDVNQKIRNVESVIRLDLGNRTIREVQPPVEKRSSWMNGPDNAWGRSGVDDDGNGIVDDIGEAGWPGSDDVPISYFYPIGFDPAQNMGYWMLEENSPADEQGEDTDDVLSFTVRVVAQLRGSGTLGTGYIGLAVTGSEPDVAYPDPSVPADGLAGSQEAEVIYFLRSGTFYRRVLLVGVPQPSVPIVGQSWYSRYDISARPPTVAGGFPIVNALGDLTYRSPRYIHQVPENYSSGYPGLTPPIEPGLAADFTANPNFPFRPLSYLDTQVSPALGAGWHDNQTAADADKELDHNQNYPASLGLTAKAELIHGRPTLRETSSPDWDYPDNPMTNVWTDYWMPPAGNPRNNVNLNRTATRPAEEAILTNVFSFDVKVWDPDARPNGSVLATGAYVDLGKMWPGASGSVTTPGPTPSNGTPSLSTPMPPNGPAPGIWPPARRLGVLNPDHRGFGEPFGYDSLFAIPYGVVLDMPLGMLRAPVSLCRTYDTWCSAYTKPTQVWQDLNSNGVPDYGEPGVPVAPPYIVPVRGIQIKIRFADPQTRLTREITFVQELQ